MLRPRLRIRTTGRAELVARVIDTRRSRLLLAALVVSHLVVILAIVLFVLERVRRSPFGRVLRAIREDAHVALVAAGHDDQQLAVAGAVPGRRDQVRQRLRIPLNLRQVAVDGSKTYFDTNSTEHHHFFVEGEHALLDIPGAAVMLDKMPTAPEGYEIARVDVVVRLRRKDR